MAHYPEYDPRHVDPVFFVHAVQRNAFNTGCVSTLAKKKRFAANKMTKTIHPALKACSQNKKRAELMARRPHGAADGDNSDGDNS